MPDLAASKELFRIHLADRFCDESIDFDELAQRSDGYVASDIELLVNEAALDTAMQDVPIGQQLLLDKLAHMRKSVSSDDAAAYETMRKQFEENNNNDGHRTIAEFDRDFEVTVITQNGDDLHERASSTNVIHLHGEALKYASTMHPYESFAIDPADPDIRIGDKAPDCSQIRPYVIFFNEDIELRLWRKVVEAAKAAEVFVFVGSTMLVYPAVDLLRMINSDCRLYIIDPDDVSLPNDIHPYPLRRIGGNSATEKFIIIRYDSFFSTFVSIIKTEVKLLKLLYYAYDTRNHHYGIVRCQACRLCSERDV